VPDVGELMLAAVSFNVQPTNWWMGEKYDGIRACWNPNTKTWYSRYANPISVSCEFNTYMPNCFLDGEIWTGRGGFTTTMHLTYLKPRHTPEERSHKFSAWNLLRFIVFDMPAPLFLSHNAPFERRYQGVLEGIPEDNPFLAVATRLTRKDTYHMQKYMREIVESGGEGVVVRKPHSVYENGRSHNILKFKTQRDGEALVVGIRGIYHICKLPNHQTFVAKKALELKSLAVCLLDIVSYKCLCLSTKGTPYHTTIYRLRKDLSWDNVVLNYSKTLV